MLPNNVHAILLIPLKGDLHGLLQEGACGARPPTAWRTDPDDPGPPWLHKDTGRLGWTDPGVLRPPTLPPGVHGGMYAYRTQRALVVAWEGAVVLEGWDQLRRVMGVRSRTSKPDLAYVAEFVQYSSWEHVWRVVLLDVDGREVTS